MGMPVFIPPTGGVFIGKWRRRSAPGESRSTLQMHSSGYLLSEECALELDGAMYCISGGSEGIWYRGQVWTQCQR